MTTVPVAVWIGFNAFVLLMLALDLGVFHRKAHEVKFREAAMWSVVWVGLAALFNVGLYFWQGSEAASAFLAGYLVEKALSVDNIFLFLVTFSAFAVPRIYQHRILFWGILGALVLRGVFIYAGAEMLESFHWTIYLFGLIVLVTGLKLFVQKKEDVDPKKNTFYRFLKKFIPSTHENRGGAFFVKENGKWLATPLFFVLMVVEVTDVLFAVESIPAVFSITQEPFLVYTSNIFAILGLRSLFFLIAGIMEKFIYLTKGLAFILVFIGVKMLVSSVVKIPIGVSLAVIVGTLVVSILLSWLKNRSEQKKAAQEFLQS